MTPLSELMNWNTDYALTSESKPQLSLILSSKSYLKHTLRVICTAFCLVFRALSGRISDTNLVYSGLKMVVAGAIVAMIALILGQ